MQKASAEPRLKWSHS